MRKRFPLWLYMLPCLCLGLPWLTACHGVEQRGTDTAESAPEGAPMSAVDALADNATEGYALALEPRAFRFPEDHGPHPEFKTEWWYFTGHLADDEGHRFGYQLTFFRQALQPGLPERSSQWATHQLYLAHFALSDIDGGAFHAFERWSRGAAGLAGAGGAAFRVWLEDWSVVSLGETDFPVRLRAHSEGESGLGESPVALDLVLDSAKPPALHGEKGLSRKGSEPGNASYYYSLTRLPSRGKVALDGREYTVLGSSWLDREWSTSVLGDARVGWDWFSLQLDDGRELMVFQLRLEDGSVDPISHGTLVDIDGTTSHLSLADFTLEVLGTWRSRHGVTYPAGWRLGLPGKSLELQLEPLLADQELDVTFRYWEGALGVTGTAGDQTIGGRGYAELVGYDERTVDR